MAEFKQQLAPITIELWDQEELSKKLRDQPQIVIEFFGKPTADIFCLPYELDKAVVPTDDAVAVSDAVARTPGKSTGADKYFFEAETKINEPVKALALIAQGETLLREAGFEPYIALHKQQRISLLFKLHKAGEAARAQLDDIWAALQQNRMTGAEIENNRLRKLAEDAPEDDYVQKLAAVGNAAIALHLNPLGELPDANTLKLGDTEDQIRLAVLAGEIALSNNCYGWLTNACDSYKELITEQEIDQSLSVRLRLLLAEGTQDWTELVSEARRNKLGNELSAFVLARYARDRANNQNFKEADTLWEEAARDACLAQCWADAATWVFSRRVFRSLWNLLTADDLLPLEIALNDKCFSRSILQSDCHAYKTALESLQNKKLRKAAIAAQRALRQSIVIADWGGEQKARRLLGSILESADEPEFAAHHFAQSGDTKAIKKLADQFPGRYLDITDYLDAPNYWTVGTAYQLLAAEADLIPDRCVYDIAEKALAELKSSETDKYIDLIFSSTSRFEGAMKVLAGIANRLTYQQADTLLTYFEQQPEVEPNHYRYHDKEEAKSVAQIAIHQAKLRKRSLAHIIPLLARSQESRTELTTKCINQFWRTAHPYLVTAVDAGSRWASEILAMHNRRKTPKTIASEALNRLTQPLKHQAGSYTVGTNAIGDSLLILSVPAAQRNEAIMELLSRAEDIKNSSPNRGDYLIAASNLVKGISSSSRKSHYARAMQLATSMSPSEVDMFDSNSAHPLNAFQINFNTSITQAKALYLAACLAKTTAEKNMVKQRTFTLLGINDSSDYWLTKTLQKLDTALNDDLGFLAGRSWPLRSLAALLWAKHPSPVHLGQILAQDKDARVRRALAGALAETAPTAIQTDVRQLLNQDPAFSVRQLMQGTSKVKYNVRKKIQHGTVNT